MDQDRSHETGLEQLVEKYRSAFRIPENLDHYSEEDLSLAEKKFLRYCLNTGSCP